MGDGAGARKKTSVLGLERLALCPEAALEMSSAVFCILIDYQRA